MLTMLLGYLVATCLALFEIAFYMSCMYGMSIERASQYKEVHLRRFGRDEDNKCTSMKLSISHEMSLATLPDSNQCFLGVSEIISRV